MGVGTEHHLAGEDVALGRLDDPCVLRRRRLDRIDRRPAVEGKVGQRRLDGAAHELGRELVPAGKGQQVSGSSVSGIRRRRAASGRGTHDWTLPPGRSCKLSAAANREICEEDVPPAEKVSLLRDEEGAGSRGRTSLALAGSSMKVVWCSCVRPYFSRSASHFSYRSLAGFVTSAEMWAVEEARTGGQ